MDFDDAKENIQPLAQGRNASILHASLRVESPQELLAQRKVLEKEIHNYSGDDPLSAWYNYIEWIEQSFPSGGKESGLQEVLSKCLTQFEIDERYRQDRRMIKLYIKFIASYKDPAECYKQLFSAGIGTMVADFYIAWAYCYDLVGNTRMADEIFLRGIACRAQPLEELQEARQHFGFAVAQRFMYQDDDPIREETNRQLHERRMALTSLRGHRRKQIVGSIRTGSAVKSVSPGKIKIDLPSTSSQRGNTRVQVFKDENENPNVFLTPTNSTATNEIGKSVVRSIIDAVRNQENQKEPGHWNKAYNRKKEKLFASSTRNSELGFEIHEDAYEDIIKPCIPPIPIADNEIKYGKPFIYPPNFCSNSKPIKGWITPVTTEETPDVNTLPAYNKCKLYPRPNMEFQVEELKGYKILKKRAIQNDFTKERDEYWNNGPKYNIRLYPHFATKSKPQTIDLMDELFIPENLPGFKVNFEEIYNKEEKIERQFEEILALRIKINKTIIENADMEETMCTTSEQIQRRKSFFPLRKSLAYSTFKSLNKISVMSDQNEKYEKSSVSELLPPSILSCPTDAKAVEDQLKAKTSIPNRHNIQKETSQALTIENTVPVAADLVLNDEKSLKTLMIQKTSNVVSAKPFEIFIDDSSVELSDIKTVPDENDFQFKTPALPIPNSTPEAVVSNKLPFEIFDDENLGKQSPNSIPKTDLSCGNGGFFDPEESCSTQTFNIFLKAQSVSTPIAIAKSKPQRQFGNILKEVTQSTIPEQKDELTDNQSYTADNQNNAPEAPPVSAYSPLRQQLSTILETSEHGTTQGTHTTGATTKSTLGSPEINVDSQAQAATNTGTKQLQTVLETVKESSCESSVIMMNSLKILNMNTNTSKTHPSENNIETPGVMRLQNKCRNDGLNFSIFEDSIKNDQGQVGNFSRLEQQEDTATGAALKTIPTIFFQDDKTETISKMLITSQQVKFQDDKTETIPKMMFEPLIKTKFQEDNTENISKMLVGPAPPIKFPEEMTDTISKIMLATPGLTKFEDGKTELEIMEEEKTEQKNMDQDHSFAFFGQTPPKLAKQLATKQIERGTVSHIRTASNNRTPLTFETKRFCEKDTPEILKIKPSSKPTVLFEDELQPYFKNKSPTNMKDSLLPDFSLIEENQQVLPQNKVKPKSKCLFRDSFNSDASKVEDSQPQTKQVQSQNHHTIINQSILSEFSIIKNTQPKSSKPELNESIIKSSQSTEPRYLKLASKQPPIAVSLTTDLEENKIYDNANWKEIPNRSIVSQKIENTQPNSSEPKHNQSIIKSSQSTESRYLKLPSKQPVAVNSITDLEENKVDDNTNWKETPNTLIVSQKTQDARILKNIMMDTFMKDFSEINEQSSLLKPINSNSSLRFLNESLKKQNSVQNRRNIPENYSDIGNISTSKDTKLNFLAPEYEGKLSDKRNRLTGTSTGKYFELNCETEMFGTNISMITNSTWLPNHGPFISESSKQLSQIQEKSLHIKSEEHSSNSLKTPEAQNQVLKHKESTKSKLSFDNKSVCNNNFSIEVSASELEAINAKSFRKHIDEPIVILESSEQNNDDNEMSIYYKQTPKTPKPQVHIWDDADAFKTTGENQYVHTEPDLNQTQQIIENIFIDPNVNPFNVDLINAFLEQHYVISYLKSLPTCQLVGYIQRLKQNATININGNRFDVIKLIGEGAYGAVFCGKEASTNKLVAMKQEKPANCWEYYICLEIQERIRADEMLPAYMSVDYALVGNNSSILISKFSQYGSLITVCNKIKKHTMKNVDEYVVMLLASELLEIMDHLHAVNIIHADVKADNFLLMNKLTYPPTKRHLQLIDFGVSIDMKLFKEGQTFSFVHNDNSCNCPEMRERRPWTYQIDLYGLAGVIHVLLFGKYMDIERKARGFWMHKTHVPRYLNKNLWDEIFKNLLNIRDCNSMPNLQELRALLKKEMEEKDRYVLKMVNEFNRYLSA